MRSYVWLDNKIVSQKDTHISCGDVGFLYGQGLFETMRCYNGQVFLLDRHIRRLIDSCPIMDIIAPQKELLKNAVLVTVDKNKSNSGYVRLNVWRKDKGIGICVFVEDMPFYSDKDYKQGFSAIIVKDVRQNETSPLARVKSLNHYFNMLLSKKANENGVDEAIILNNKNNICEGARSNIFIIKDKKIFTPTLASGCLAGITREVVMEIAKQLKIELKETDIKPKDLFTSDEAFLTNSLIEIMPLTKIDDKPIKGARPGQITKSILKRYRELIRNKYR